MRKYTSIFATSEHFVIKSIADMGTWGNRLGFFLNGKPIGTGRIKINNRNKKWLSTTGTEIFTKFRNKGHGIELYRALIETVRTIGATRIYSDISLNKFSRRMWKEKLARLGYVVKETNKCSKACKHCAIKTRFYIDLVKK